MPDRKPSSDQSTPVSSSDRTNTTNITGTRSSSSFTILALTVLALVFSILYYKYSNRHASNEPLVPTTPNLERDSHLSETTNPEMSATATTIASTIAEAAVKSASSRTPVYFFSHGGPTFMYEEDPMGDKGAFNRIRKIGAGLIANPPKALVIFSAHWQAEGGFGSSPRTVRVTHRDDENPLIYDYYGFPKHMYQEKFKSVGNTTISSHINDLLNQAGFQSKLEPKRGLDHGVFVPLKVAFENSGTEMLPFPIIQVSLLGSEDPIAHYELGKAISSLRDENILVIGSGMSVHNLREMGHYFNGPPAPYAKTFDHALKLAVEVSNPSNISESLAKVLERPDARKAHPTFEHILPIMVAAGAADQDNGKQLYTSLLSSLAWAIYKFGN